jgi:hypothetical protein
MLDAIQRGAFGYFLHETNRANGLVLDKTWADWPAIENHQSGLVWRLTRGCPSIVAGLRAAGFTGGWLSSDD